MPDNRAAFEELWQTVCGRPSAGPAEDEELARIAQTLTVAPVGDVEERAWALNALAAALATLGLPGEALAVLRASVRVEASNEARIASFACAAVIRADQGEFEDAARLARMVEDATGDPELLRALGRALEERAREAGDEELLDAALGCVRWADLEDAYAA
ncbi:MAG: hypothetical protein ABR583_02540 [Gaiellaceae bacterium]